MKVFYILFVVIVVSLTGCSSTPNRSTPENTPDVVLSRIDDLKERPSWLHESEPFKIENGSLVSLGMTSIPGGDRTEAGMRIAQSNAKHGIATAIQQVLNYRFQNGEEGTSMDANRVNFIATEAAQLTTSTIRPSKYYWEKVATTLDSGERVTRYKVFATVMMPEEEFKKAVYAAIAKAQGKPGVSVEFAKKLDGEWDRMTAALGSSNDDSRKPASENPKKDSK